MAGLAVPMPCPTAPATRRRSFASAAASASSGRGGAAKKVYRNLSSLQAAATCDPFAADRLARKLIASSSKSAALDTLSSLLSQSSVLAPIMYQRMREANWFRWNPKLAAGIIALLEEHGRASEAETLILESLSGLDSPRDIAFFHCDLIEAFSERGLKQPAIKAFAQIKEKSLYGRRPFESIVKGLCLMGFPSDAEMMFNEMCASGFKPSPIVFRSIVQGYGRAGEFLEMKRVIGIMEEAGCKVDTVCANIVISCYGDHGALAEITSWISEMRESRVDFSVRTFNSVLNSCPTMASMMQDIKSLPLSIEGLLEKIVSDSQAPYEGFLVQELLNSQVLAEKLVWSPSEGKLDLHGFHLASAYVILLQWVKELRMKLEKEKIIPLEISVVCGLGRHSRKVGDSPLKMLVSEMMFRMKSPLKIDGKNVGRFFAKGKAARDWLC